MGRLTLSLLGGFEVRSGSGSPTAIPTKKAQALLAYLVLTPDQMHPRDKLAALLWGDRTPASARNSLRQTLFVLRKALDSEARATLIITGDAITLAPDAVQTDVAAFRRAVAEGTPTALEHAAALYRGDLLAGLAVAEPAFEDWLMSERERLHELALEALARLLGRQLATGAAAAGVQTALQLLALDPLEEAAHRALMRLYVQLGRRDAALRQYQHCVETLQRELRVEPEPETKQLYQEFKDLDVPSDFPMRSLDARRHNLPVQLTRFIGREREMSDLKKGLETNRLLTVSGPGGGGKTRLALQVAADLVDRYSDGVWLVQMAAVAEPALVPRVVASALEVREQPGRSIVATLRETLAPKTLLLLLDNCEHIAAACAQLVTDLLVACPDVRVLVTSREPLGLRGEMIWRVPVLSTPNALTSATAEAVNKFEAVQLFVDRAHSADAGFELTDDNAATVAAICYRLDGIPLALELAAARVQALTVDEISTRLRDRFRLLTSASGTALPHHRTLRAAIDWSHDPLTELERALLRRLSVFTGGFTLAAAERVCASGAIKPDDVLELLSGLVMRSLVLLERPGLQGRYRLLETVREYALEKLVAAGEEGILRNRHLAWYIGFAERAEPELRGSEQHLWLDRLDADLDNFRAAFGWSLLTKDPADALRLAAALLEFWVIRADWSEGRRWVEEALRLPGEVDDSLRMKALRAAGELSDVLSDYPRAMAHFEASLAVARKLGDRRGIAAALLGLAHEAQRVGTFAATRPLVQESVALLRELGDEPSLARSLGGLAWLEAHYAVARSLWEENLAIRRRLGNRESVGWSAINVGLAAQGAGDYAAARAAYEESLALGRELDYKRMVARALTQLGEVARLEGNLTEARSLFEQTIRMWRENRHRSGLVDSLRGLGDVTRLEGGFAVAQLLLEESLSVCREIGARPGIAAALQSLGDLAGARGNGEGAKRHYRSALTLWDEMEHADGIARCTQELANIVAIEGRADLAAVLLGASEALREQIGAIVPPVQRKVGTDAR